MSFHGGQLDGPSGRELKTIEKGLEFRIGAMGGVRAVPVILAALLTRGCGSYRRSLEATG